MLENRRIDRSSARQTNPAGEVSDHRRDAGISDEAAALRAENAELKALVRALQIDTLTNLDRKERFDEQLAALLPHEGADSNSIPRLVSVVYADIDFFKDVNSQYGHDDANTVLEMVASVLRRSVRAGDMFVDLGRDDGVPLETDGIAIAGRLGGEEMALVLPGMSEEQAAERAEEIRKMVNKLSFGKPGDPMGMLKVGISIGVATSDKNISPLTAQELVRRADAAMLYAKENGRNRVMTDSKFRDELSRQGELALDTPSHPTLGLIGIGRAVGMRGVHNRIDFETKRYLDG